MIKKELVEFLIENFTNKQGIVDLDKLDFGDKIVLLDGMKAKEIYQSRHEANGIYQEAHIAKEIHQDAHEAEIIHQDNHEAKEIIQDNIIDKIR